MNSLQDIKCGNPVCKVLTNKSCVEGFDVLADCPFFGKDKADGSAIAAPLNEEAQTESNQPQAKSLKLSTGDWLSVTEATEICMSNRTLVFVLVGPVKSGKTSLLASVYHLIAHAKFKSFRFARSSTLREFERTCHHVRGSSGRKKPAMERTPFTNNLPGGVGFYHLGLVETESDQYIDYLIADRTGEDYRNASSDCSLFTKFPELQRADCITVLVDGEKLGNTAARHRVKAEVEKTMQALKDGNIFSRTKPDLSLVLTKLDLVQQTGKEHASTTLQNFESLVDKIKDRYGKIYRTVQSHRLAASPDDSNVLPYGHGVEDLLKFWARSENKLPHTFASPSQITREIERYCHLSEFNL